MQRGDGGHQDAEVGDGEAEQVHVHHTWTPGLQWLHIHKHISNEDRCLVFLYLDPPNAVSVVPMAMLPSRQSMVQTPRLNFTSTFHFTHRALSFAVTQCWSQSKIVIL